MPHTESAKKSLRKNEKRRLHNREIKKAIKMQIKTLLQVASEAKMDEMSKEFALACKKLDKAAAKRVIHPNKAARTKSRLNKRIKLLAEKGKAQQAAAAAKNA